MIDVCIIGAGPAGLVLARELAGSKLRVCLLESGTKAPPLARDPLYELHTPTLPIAHDSRVRTLGGTTATWSGRWKHLDPIDFERRAYVPHSGWPITYDELQPFRDRADRIAGFAPVATPPPLFHGDTVIPTWFRTQPKAERHWGKTLGATLEVQLDAHVIRLEATSGSVTRVIARQANRELVIAPRAVVLATGGIENARLLLLSELGNRHDQVGRYYMDHPKSKCGMLEAYEPIERARWHSLTPDAPSYVGFRIADDVQRRHGLLNSHVLLQPLFERDLVNRLVRRVREPAECRLFAIRSYLEQAPDPANRVTLHTDLDPLGLRKASVQWSIGVQDLESITVLHEQLARELQRAGIGELESPLLHGAPLDDLGDASHHMGTTRMGTDPQTSVVDASCRVHDLANLFVAGSSLFPTGGYANPTATLVALAIRLADHLKDSL